jgi:hypothetical protein
MGGGVSAVSKMGANGAGLNDDGVHLRIRIVERETHRCFGDAQMRSGTDGKKLGQALNDSQQD